MQLYSHRLIRSSLLLGFGINCALCNTEIINFAASAAVGFDPMTASLFNWPVLNASHSTLSLRIDPSRAEEGTSWDRSFARTGPPGSLPHELWAILDLDSLLDISDDDAKFTLRLSWPAWFAVDFDIALVNASSLAHMMHPPPSRNRQLSRRHYARIRSKNAGVHPPDLPKEFRLGQVDFRLTLEKLHYGVVPATLMPSILPLLFVLTVSCLVALWVLHALKPVVERAKRELGITTQHKKNT